MTQNVFSYQDWAPVLQFINISQLLFLRLISISYRTKKAHISAPDNTLIQSKR